MPIPPRYNPTELTQLRRRTHRGYYDAKTVHSILDAAVMGHVGYVHEGQSIVHPTAYWREGEWLYWHGSAAGRAIASQLTQRVCFTVSLVDALVLGRCGFTHSMLFRSVMAFGQPEKVEGMEAKRQAMDALVDRLYPRRTAEIRSINEAELAAITVVRLALKEVSAKIRDGGVNEVQSDMDAPCWAGVLPLRTTIGEPVPDQNLKPGTPLSPAIAGYAPGTDLETALKTR